MDATKTKGFCILDYGEDVIAALPPWNDDSSDGRRKNEQADDDPNYCEDIEMKPSAHQHLRRGA